jgi:DNA-binding beta-propeller fold protein YncE
MPMSERVFRRVRALAALSALALAPQAFAQPSCSDREGPPVDVAGHLAIAARTDLEPLRGLWRWGAVPVGIAVGGDGSVVWAEYRTDTIERADREGRHIETMARIDGPLDVAVDPASGQLFYTADRHYPRSVGSVGPGEEPSSLVCGRDVNRPFAITFTPSDKKLYWTESINGRIRSARADGAGSSTLFDDGIAIAGEQAGVVAASPAGIAVDEKAGFVYWSELRTATIVRARLDGSERTTILGREQGLELPAGLAIDAAGKRLCWADPGSETIGCASLDGSQPKVVASAADGVLEPYGLAVDDERRLLYWTDVARNAIYRASLDRKSVERFVDLDRRDSSTPQTEASAGTCEAVVSSARTEFLRRWVKLVRTCVIGVTATQAVIRLPADLALPAGLCARQLGRAHDIASFRAELARACDARRVYAAIDETLDLGAAIVAADLPHATSYLHKIRPFIAGDAARRDAVAALDGLVARLERVERAPASTFATTLPVSGQTTSYAATRMGKGPAAVPDDGAVGAGKPLAYADNEDGTITDRATGLTWEKKCSGCGGLHDAATRYRRNGSSEEENGVRGWLSALNAEGGSGFAGHADWRVPEIAELVSIIDYERFNPALSGAFDGSGCALGCTKPEAHDCSCSAMGPYWTARDSPDSSGNLPVVLSNLGLVLGHPNDKDAFVRAVRGPRLDPASRFVDNGDGTITDRATLLMWEKKHTSAGSLHDVERRLPWSFDAQTETIWDWLAAVNGEGGHGFAGHDDWRIPNVKELYSLVDASRSDPAIAAVFAGEACADLRSARCGTTAKSLHWTSTTLADFPALALTVNFGLPGKLEREPPPGVIRVERGIEPHEKTLGMVIRAVRGPVETHP